MPHIAVRPSSTIWSNGLVDEVSKYALPFAFYGFSFPLCHNNDMLVMLGLLNLLNLLNLTKRRVNLTIFDG